jgi:hypothetical protein
LTQFFYGGKEEEEEEDRSRNFFISDELQGFYDFLSKHLGW